MSANVISGKVWNSAQHQHGSDAAGDVHMADEAAQGAPCSRPTGGLGDEMKPGDFIIGGRNYAPARAARGASLRNIGSRA